MREVPPPSCTFYKPYLLKAIPHTRCTSILNASYTSLYLVQIIPLTKRYLIQSVPRTNHTSHKLYLTQSVPRTNHTSHKLYLTQVVPPTRSCNLSTVQRGFICAKTHYFTHRINSIYFVTFIRNDKISLILTSDGFTLVTLGPLPGLNVNGI